MFCFHSDVFPSLNTGMFLSQFDFMGVTLVLSPHTLLHSTVCAASLGVAAGVSVVELELPVRVCPWNSEDGEQCAVWVLTWGLCEH